MWADNETSEDLLGFKVHADLLLDLINDKSILPVTIGVFGDWGSGKSSILKIIHEELEKEEYEKSLCIYFNGWTFEGYEDAKSALLYSILKELEDNKKLLFEVKDDIKHKVSKMWKSIDWIKGSFGIAKKALVPIATSYITGGVNLLPQLFQSAVNLFSNKEELVKKLQSEEGDEIFKSFTKDEGESEDKLRINAIADFRKDFQDLIEATKFDRLVIIIDDLDRCSPERIIENLEAIKLFLNVPKTAFIIGADPRIVKHAIENKYKNNKDLEDDNNRIVIDYLEKLIQIPYSLPKLSDSEVETYISMLICKKELDDSKFKKILSIFHDYRKNNRYSAFGLANMQSNIENTDFDKIKSSIITIPALAPLITTSLYGNPRQIKRFLNTYTLRKRLAKVASLYDFKDDILAKLMILEYSEPKLFTMLFNWQSAQDGISKELEELEETVSNSDKLYKDLLDNKYKDWNKEKIIKWLKVEPILSNIDLRDYFWITRDKLNDSISGTSMIPPAVRALFNSLLPDKMTVSVTRSLINEKFKLFTDIEKDVFFNLLSSNLKRNPQQKRLYDIFNIMVEDKIDDTIYHYIECLKIINVSNIEAAVATTLAHFKLEPEFGDFLNNYFKDGKSKASKAFNLKK